MRIRLAAQNPCLANMDSWVWWPTSSRFDPNSLSSYFASLSSYLFLQGKQDGFFLECGALDGEYLSNTLLFELQLGWSVGQSCFGQLVRIAANTFKGAGSSSKQTQKHMHS